MNFPTFIIVVLFSSFRYISTSSVTYPGIGTFYSTDLFHPLHRASTLFFLPQSPQELDPQFSLYTRSNPQLVEMIRWNSSEDVLNSKYFNASNPTKIIIHGFLENHSVFAARWMRKMKNYFLDYADLNVFLVDWPKGNSHPYHQAVVNTRVIGAMLAVQIESLCQGFTRCTPNQFHIIGHSLGAQAASYAGKFLNGTLGQITGLDPAGPYFEGLGPKAHLWYTDARFVDVIHTDARFLIGFGTSEAWGHVDFYVNGGSAQAGCNTERFSMFYLKGYIDGLRTMFVCDHMRAIEYYIEALARSRKNGTPPIAYACESYDDYQNGKCTHECAVELKNAKNHTVYDGIQCVQVHSNSHQGNQCVMLGPRAIEYAENNFVNQNQYRKKFYISTAEHEPYFR